MRKLYLILLVFVFNSIICFGSEQIELSSRLGKTITPESRDYFGLFPNVKDFKSAVLIKDSINNYLEITAGKLDIRTTTVISDSSIFALRYVIDNFEKIISNRIKITINPKYAVNYLVIGTKYNNKAKLLRITLKDSTSFQSFIIYSDSNAIVTTPDSIYNPSTSPLRITEYSDIYSISGVSYHIIDRTKEIFVLNLQQFSKYALFTNYNKANVTPPEVLKLINNQTKTNETNYYESKLNFNRLYFKRMMLSVDYSYQWFDYKADEVRWFNDEYAKPVLFRLNHLYSFGIKFDYKISKILGVQIGYDYDIMRYEFGSSKLLGDFLGNALNINMFCNVWHNKDALYMRNQIFADIYGGFRLIKYRRGGNLGDEYIHYYENDEITKKIRQSFKLGLSLRYNYGIINCLYINTYVDYHNDYGVVNFQYYNSKYIDYFLGYGITIGYGAEF